MKLHPWSFLLGLASAAAALAARGPLRPVAVEVAAFAGHLGKAGWALVERKVEALEDLRAEISERMRERARRPVWADEPAKATPASSANGVARPRSADAEA